MTSDRNDEHRREGGHQPATAGPATKAVPVTTFPITTALSGLFLWIIFGYLTVLLNCDLQRVLKHNPIALHLAGIVAFYFLFTVLDANVAPIWLIWLKTIGVYALFVMMTKSKWYFVLPVMLLILADQCMRQQVAYEVQAGTNVNQALFTKISTCILVVIVVLIVVGCLHYTTLQAIEYGPEFSWYEFFFGINTSCKPAAPEYEALRASKPVVGGRARRARAGARRGRSR